MDKSVKCVKTGNLPPCGFYIKEKLSMKHDVYDIQGLVEASYRQGFSDGYDAAVMALEALLRGLNLPKDDPLLLGTKKAKMRAYEFMRCPPTAEKVSVLPNDGKFH